MRGTESYEIYARLSGFFMFSSIHYQWISIFSNIEIPFNGFAHTNFIDHPLPLGATILIFCLAKQILVWTNGPKMFGT